MDGRNVRVRLKGLNRKTVTLADGRVVKYYYAWKGGPPLRGEPGSPEIVAVFTMKWWRGRSPRRRRAVDAHTLVRRDAGVHAIGRSHQGRLSQVDVPHRSQVQRLSAGGLGDRRTRGVFNNGVTGFAKSSKRQADYAWVVLARTLSVARDYGKINTNPCEKGGRLYSGSRRDLIWSLEDEAAYLASGRITCACRFCWRCGRRNVKAT